MYILQLRHWLSIQSLKMSCHYLKSTVCSYVFKFMFIERKLAVSRSVFGPCQISMNELSCVNSERVSAVNYLRKNPLSYMFNTVQSTPLVLMRIVGRRGAEKKSTSQIFEIYIFLKIQLSRKSNLFCGLLTKFELCSFKLNVYKLFKNERLYVFSNQDMCTLSISSK